MICFRCAKSSYAYQLALTHSPAMFTESCVSAVAVGARAPISRVTKSPAQIGPRRRRGGGSNYSNTYRKQKNPREEKILRGGKGGAPKTKKRKKRLDTDDKKRRETDETRRMAGEIFRKKATCLPMGGSSPIRRRFDSQGRK